MSHVGEKPWWPIQSPNEERKRLRCKEDKSKFTDLRFERRQGSLEEADGKMFHKLHLLGINDYL